MINKPNVDDLVKKTVNRYELVNAISKRAREIINGSEPKVNTKEKSNLTISALEFNEKKYFINRHL